MAKSEVKKVRLDLRSKGGAKKLAKLIDEGWIIQSQQKRGALQTFPGQTDVVLTRPKPERTVSPQPARVASGTVPMPDGTSKPVAKTSDSNSNLVIGLIAIIAIIAVVIWFIVQAFGGHEELRTASSPTQTQTQTTTPSTPAPTTERDATDGGVTFGVATVACDHAGEALYPYGWDAHWIMGKIGEEITANSYFVKASVDVTNEFDAKEELVVECTVTGSEAEPEVTAIDVY